MPAGWFRACGGAGTGGHGDHTASERLSLLICKMAVASMWQRRVRFHVICKEVNTELAKTNHLKCGGSHQHFTEADPKTQEVSNFIKSTQLAELS